MFELTIEQKILLAEKVMGWKDRQYHDIIAQLARFWFVGKSVYAIDEESHGEDWREWRPEADEGDAARLMLALPQVELFKFTDGEIKAHSSWLNAVQSKDFCETICRLALVHAEESKNEQ